MIRQRTARAPRPGLATRLAGRGRWSRLGLAFAAGAAMTLAQPPVSVPWVLFLAVPLLSATIAASPGARGAAAAGWAAGFGHFVTGLHWIGHAFVVDAERFAWALPFAVTLLPAGLALYWALAGALARWLAPEGGVRGALALAAALATAEVARGHLLTGFPWALAGYAWLDTPVAQAAAWAGPWGLTLVTLALAALPLAPITGRRQARGTTARILPGAAAAMAVAALWTQGAMRLADPPPGDPEAPVLRIVQQNAAQALKWRDPHRARFLETLERESAAPPDPALGPPDITVWPETALPYLPQDAPELLARAALAAAPAHLVAGALFYARDAAGERAWSNSLLVATPDGEIVARYDKRHLVPFGEYLPGRVLLERLGLEAIAGMAGAGMVPGSGPRRVEVAGIAPFAPAICYEMIFPAEVVGPGPRPRWIAHLTNDSWFGAFAGPQQHLAQARMRAIEQGLPVARAAQTGISALIDADGRVRATVALDSAGRIDAALPPARPATPYARTGDGPALAALALLLAALALLRRRA